MHVLPVVVQNAFTGPELWFYGSVRRLAGTRQSGLRRPGGARSGRSGTGSRPHCHSGRVDFGPGGDGGCWNRLTRSDAASPHSRGSLPARRTRTTARSPTTSASWTPRRLRQRPSAPQPDTRESPILGLCRRV